MRFCGLLLALTPMVFAAAEYRAGVARVDITPPIGHQMGGYAARKHGSTGLHDPLYATVLVIETANNSVAFVTCDLRSFVSTRVGELAKQKFNIQTTLIDVSHDHSGPLTWELRSPWYAEAEDKMVEAIGRPVSIFRRGRFTLAITAARSSMGKAICGGAMRRSFHRIPSIRRCTPCK
jgi:neutral ceramidase